MFAQLAEVDPAKLSFSTYFGGSAYEAVLAGKATVAVSSAYSSYEKEIKAGRLRLIGTSAAKRRPDMDAPTLTEQGIALVFENWRGIVAAPGITAQERQALARAVGRMARSPAWKAILEEKQWTDAYLAGPAFDEFLRSEQARVERAFRASGMLT